MKNLDTFEFLPAKTDSSGYDHDKWTDVLGTDWGVTTYEHKLSNVHVTSFQTSGGDAAAGLLLPAVQAFAQSTPAHQNAQYPNNDDAMNLINWAFDEIA